MISWRFVIILVIGVVVGISGYDGINVANANRDVRSTAANAAAAAAHAYVATTGADTDKATAAHNAATAVAQKAGDVVSAYNLLPNPSRITLTVSGTAKSLVLHLFDHKATDDINATATADLPT